MAHMIDLTKGKAAFVSFQRPAWHGLGVTMKDALTVQDALIKGGLDFQVLKLPNIHLLPNGEELISTDSFFTVRTDEMKVLGVHVGRKYEVMQNQTALNFVDEILQSGKATIETAGAIDEGRKVFILLKYAKDIAVKTGDIINQYFLFSSSHDGSASIVAMGTNVRVVCWNTLSAALSAKEGKIKIRHTANAADRVKEAMKVLKVLEEGTEINAENYGRMAENVISKTEMFDYFGNIFLDEKEIAELQAGNRTNDVISTRTQNVLAAVLQFANKGIGQYETMKGNDFTMWSAYNAVTGYLTGKNYANVNDRTDSLLFGSAAATIQEAGVLALNPAKITPLRKMNIDGLNLN